MTCRFFPDNSAGTGSVYAWGAQLEGGSPSILRPYQAVVGTSPFTPKTENRIEVTDSVALASEALPTRVEDFGDTNVWTLDGASLDTNTKLDPFEFGTTTDTLTAVSGNKRIYRVVTNTALEAGNLILQHGKVYRFRCYVGNDGSGATASSIKIGSSSDSVFTEVSVTHSSGAPTETNAGDGAHDSSVVRVGTTFNAVVNPWYLMEVSITYDKEIDDGTVVCEITADTSGTGYAYIWGAQFYPDGGYTAVHGQPLVQETPNGLAPRESKLIAVSLGCVLNVNPYTRAEILQGGSSALDQKARHVSTTTLYQKFFATDGSRSVVYDPVDSGIVEPFKARLGEVPARAQLISNWRGRLMMARTADDPHAWFMSAIEDPFDWDYFTPPLSSAKAVFSGTSRAGRAPDIINSICPYDDQQLILGCDHALWYLPGDPYSGAQWQLLSDVTGMHYGNHAWCKDPQGWVYFFGARGGFYRMAPGGRPERMTENTIERRLSDLNLDDYYVECHWNWREEGIHIFVVPFGGGGATVQHYFWGRRFNEWREDEFSATAQQPTAAAVLDGDKATDRRLIIASEDLHVLEWDETAKSDDGAAIESKELIGPFSPPFDQEARWSAFEAVMSTGSDGVSFSLYDNETAEETGTAKATGSLAASRNPRKMVRAKGANLWIELANSNAEESWSFESGMFEVSPAGRTRDR